MFEMLIMYYSLITRVRGCTEFSVMDRILHRIPLLNVGSSLISVPRSLLCGGSETFRIPRLLRAFPPVGR